MGWILGTWLCAALTACGDDQACKAGTCADASSSSVGSGSPSRTDASSGTSTFTGTVAQGAACTRNGECEPVPDPCRMAVCVSGLCASAAKPKGTVLPDEERGDCQRLICDRGGELALQPDPADIPQGDGDPCHVGACDGTTPEQAPAPAGTPCGDDMMCNAGGTCSACAASGAACSVSSECCDGFCDRGTCVSCPEEMGDCDGAAANGCETTLIVDRHCGKCSRDCAGRPNVDYAYCGLGECRISSCLGDSADVDGDFENGCEGVAQIGDSGPYAACTNENESSVCGPGEVCSAVMTVGGVLFPGTGAGLCPGSNIGCFCGFPCASADDCPTPTTGNAVLACSGHCYLRCGSGVQCPDGMTCSSSTVPSPMAACVWP